jgi:hypothetical protein
MQQLNTTQNLCEIAFLSGVSMCNVDLSEPIAWSLAHTTEGMTVLTQTIVTVDWTVQPHACRTKEYCEKQEVRWRQPCTRRKAPNWHVATDKWSLSTMLPTDPMSKRTTYMEHATQQTKCQ